MRTLTIIIMIVLIFSPIASAEMFFIQEVVDGNTLRLLSGETVRLIGVEIPEIRPDMTIAEKTRITNNRQRAKEYVRGLVSGAKADLQFDVKTRDAEGNILAYAWFLYPEKNVQEALEFNDDYMMDAIVEDWGENQYVTFLNAAIIKAGYGIPGKDADNKEHDALFITIHQQKTIPTLQAKGLGPIDLSKVTQ